MKSVENKSNKIVIFGSTVVLPGATEPLPPEFDGSSSVLTLELHGDIALHEWPVSQVQAVDEGTLQVPAVKAQDTSEILAELKKMRKKTEIQALATDLEVEFNAEDTNDALREKITTALTTDPEATEQGENQ